MQYYPTSALLLVFSLTNDAVDATKTILRGDDEIESRETVRKACFWFLWLVLVPLLAAAAILDSLLAQT